MIGSIGMDYLNWSTIPPHILVSVFSYLHPNDRVNPSVVCRDWSECFRQPQVWRRFTFNFDTTKDKDGKALVCVDKYSQELRQVEIMINQTQAESRDRAMYVLDKLIDLKRWKLQEFRFGFTAANPLCFKGKIILDKLKLLLNSITDKESVLSLEVIDLSKLDIVLDDTMLNILSEKHSSLQMVHIQNSCLIDNITPIGVLKLVSHCTHLQELFLFYHCLTDNVVIALSQKNRSPLQTLSLMCNRSDKYLEIVSSAAWKALRESSPDIKLIIRFDSTMPRHRIIPILCSDIPATTIDIHLYAWVHEEIEHIANECHSTLTYLSCHTSVDPNSQANVEMIPALLLLVSKCTKLNELHCHCKLPEDTISALRAIRKLTKSTLYSANESQ